MKTGDKMSFRNQKNSAIVLATAIMVAAFLVSLFTGKYHISFSQILNPESTSSLVFLNLRLGRTLMACIAGASLALAGHIFQIIFRNPLASPDITGVASGAGTGAAAAILLFGYNGIVTSFSAFLGGMISVALVLFLAKFVKSGGTVKLLLSGIVVNSISEAVLMMVKLCSDTDQKLSSIEFWLMGSFASITIDKISAVICFVLAGFMGILVMNKKIILLSLPDDEAEMLGVNVKTIRVLSIIAATLITSAVVSVTGLISFIGLLAPHISKHIISEGNPKCIALTAIIGMNLMLISDIIARSLLVSEIPISVITSLIGAPVLFILLFKRGEMNG